MRVSPTTSPLRATALTALLAASAGANPHPSPQAEVAHTLTVSDGVAVQSLTFGLDPCASDGLDPCVGEPNLPPLPPLGAFDARFVGLTLGLSMDQGSWVDIRQGDSQTQASFVHELSLQLGFGSSWSIGYALPNGVDCVLEDLFGGLFFQETLLGAGEVKITNPALNRLLLKVTYGPPHPLFAKTHSISLATGGDQKLALDAGAAHAQQLYLLLGSISGTAPGVAIDGQLLPLNPDAWFVHTLTNPNQAPLTLSLGLLDGAGHASAEIKLPPSSSPQLAGLELHHAFVALDSSVLPGALVVGMASNAVPLSLAP